MRIFLKAAKGLLLLAQVVLMGGLVWLGLESRAPVPRDAAAEREGAATATFEVGRGRGVRAIAADLKAKGVLRKTTPFVLRYEMFYHPQGLKAGEYQLPLGAAPGEVLETLIKGKVFLHPVTVAEGLTGAETIEVFVAAGFGRREDYREAFRKTGDVAPWDPRAADLEGYLFPETYRLPRGLAPNEILRKMTAQFAAVFGEAERRRAAALGMSVRDAVTLASLIEKETSIPIEKRLVSAVFHNRLRIGMKLDCDPTIIYALKLAGPFEGRLLSKDLKYESLYNTYLHPGLPPGPIANPGRDSIAAALEPADADYLYFVARGDGSHEFSRTFAEHRAAVARFRRQAGR